MPRPSQFNPHLASVLITVLTGIGLHGCVVELPEVPELNQVCGDRQVAANEACDDGNLLSNDGCTELCQLARCGDGFKRLDLGPEDEGYERISIGWFLAVNPILIVMFEMVVVHALRNRPTLPIVALGSLVVGLGYLVLLAPLGGMGIVMAMAIVAGGELLQMPLLSAHINDRAPANARGAYNGFNGMVFSAALIVAPAIGGRIYERYGPDTLWLICGALGAIAAGMFWLAARSSAKNPAGEDIS